MRVFVNLSDTEAVAAARGELKVLVRPLKEQPPSDCRCDRDDVYSARFEDEFGCRIVIGKRYPVGSELWLREAHRDALYKRNAWDYKVDCPPDYTCWSNAVTMPSAAVRHKPVVKSNRVCLANEVRMIEWAGNGMKGRMRGEVYFTRRYPKLDFDRTWVEVVGI